MKKTLIFLFFIFFSPLVLAQEKIRKVDREQLYREYQPPIYQLPEEKIAGLTFEQKINYLKHDVYEYALKIYDDHRIRTKSAMTLIQPQKTKDTINLLINTLAPDEAHFNITNLEKMINAAAQEQMRGVVSASKDPSITFTNDLYEEILVLKEDIEKFKEKNLKILESGQTKKRKENDSHLLLLITIGMSIAAVILNVINLKKR